MPAAARSEITQAILDAIAESGGVGFLISEERETPRKFLVSYEGKGLLLWAYAWTLTPGGRRNLPDEFRIQMTGVNSPLPANPEGPTVLLGYDPGLDIFAGFDFERHKEFTPGSPSVQISIRTIRDALQDGISFTRKSNNEIAVGIRPDFFLFYCTHAPELHEAGEKAEVFNALDKASRLEDTENEIALLPQERRRVVQEVSRLARSSNFRMQVLQAYNYRCAVTRAQLGLVEAAHILPVSFPGSVDDVRNGIALSPTYHRAFDLGLIYLDASLIMRLNEEKLNHLKSIDRAGGIETFKAMLGKIHLPPARNQWPDPHFIKLANEARGIA